MDRINTRVIYRLLFPDNFANWIWRHCRSWLAGQYIAIHENWQLRNLFRNMSLTFNMSANPVLSSVFLSRLSPDSNFRESDCMLQRSLGLLDACLFFLFYAILHFFLFICLIIIMSYYLIISNLLSFNVYFTPNWWLEHVSQGQDAITLSLCKNEAILMLI